MKSSILDTRVMRGADIYNDHYLVRTRIRLKLARNGERTEGRERFNVRKLQSEEIRKSYNVEVRNRFQVLEDIEDQEEEHDKILEAYTESLQRKSSGRRGYRVNHGLVMKRGRMDNDNLEEIDEIKEID